jgi:hypothetical protein
MAISRSEAVGWAKARSAVPTSLFVDNPWWARAFGA